MRLDQACGRIGNLDSACMYKKKIQTENQERIHSAFKNTECYALCTFLAE